MRAITLLLFIFSFSVKAQLPSIQWQKRHGGSLTDGGKAIRQKVSDNYLVAGDTKFNDGDVIGYHPEN